MAGARLIADGRDVGAGFAIAPRLALTAAHVVRGRRAESLQYAEAGAPPRRVSSVRSAEDLDAALLELDGEALTVFGIADIDSGQAWQVDTQQYANDPVLTGAVTVRRHRISHQEATVDVIQLEVRQSLLNFSGYSGSPVTTDGMHAFGLLSEQVLTRDNRARGTAIASNVLYAVPLVDAAAALGVPVVDAVRTRPVSALARLADLKPTRGSAPAPWEPASTPFAFVRGTVLDDIAFSPAGDMLAGRGGPTVQVWNLEEDDELCRLDHDDPVTALAFSGRGDRLVTAAGLMIRVWQLGRRPEILRMWQASATVRGLAVTTDGSWVAVAVPLGSSKLWNVDDDRSVELPEARHQMSVAFDPTGERLAAGDSTGTTRMWRVRGYELRRESRFTDGLMVDSVSFSPGGTWLTSTARDGRSGSTGDPETAVVRHVVNGLPAGRLPHPGDIAAAAVSPDDHLLATGGFRDIRLWPVGGDTEPVVIRSEHLATGLAFSPDSTILATAVWDQPACLYDLSGNGASSILDHGAPVRHVRFDNTGRLATATADEVRIWRRSV